jgi:hypothetical protein
MKNILNHIFTYLFIFIASGCYSEDLSDVKKIGFLKQVFIEYYYKNQVEIHSIHEIECLKKYPKKFQNKVISEFELGNIKLNITDHGKQYFIFWDHSDRVISLSKRGETEIKRKIINH